MGMIGVNTDELMNVVQTVNLVRIKCLEADHSIVAPVLFASEESLDVFVDFDRVSWASECEKKIVIKFQKNGFEYITQGEVKTIQRDYPSTMTLRLFEAQKFYNMRRYIRFDTLLDAEMISGNEAIPGIVKNISKGGAMVTSDKDLDETQPVSVVIHFDAGFVYKTEVKILRKTLFQQSYTYGIQFLNSSEEEITILNRAISKYERDYFRSLNMIKEYNKKSDVYLDTKIVILSYVADESFEIKEQLMKFGAENFQLYNNFKYYVDFFIEENPRIVMIDTQGVNDEILGIIENIKEGFPEIDILLFISMTEGEPQNMEEVSKGVTLLYKPLICNEFEEIMVKYL